MISSRGETGAVARADPTWGRAAGFALFIWGVVVWLFSCFVVTPKLYLIYHYGWSRVQRDGLSIVEWGARRETWIISNGDRLRVWDFEQEIITIAACLAIMAVTVPFPWLLWLLLTRNKRAKVAGGRKK